MSKQPATKRPRVTVDELMTFVETFQNATSVESVAITMGWPVTKVRTQATRLRKQGVPLRKFRRQSLTETDIKDLKELCKANPGA